MLNVVLRTVMKLYGQDFDKCLLRNGERTANSANKLVKNFFWKRRIILTKFEKTTHNLNAKPLKKRVPNKIFSLKGSSEDVESCSRTVVYLASRKSEVFTQVWKVLRNMNVFQKILRLYLQTCRALFWQQCRKKVERGWANSI